jgi:hypothetical protein
LLDDKRFRLEEMAKKDYKLPEDIAAQMNDEEKYTQVMSRYA